MCTCDSCCVVLITESKKWIGNRYTREFIGSGWIEDDLEDGLGDGLADGG